MRVYFSKYRYHWVSPYTILEKVLFWKDWENISYNEPWVERWSDRLEPACKLLQKFLDVVHPKVDYIKIDHWDTWGMDHTLSQIVVPMLKQLKETKHGAPYVDDEDVPEGIGLRSTEAPPKENEYDVDENWFKRWDWVMGEMIWAHEQIADENSEDKFFDHSEITDEDRKSLNSSVNKIKMDTEGLKAHNERIQRGLILFARYYRGLWD